MKSFVYLIILLSLVLHLPETLLADFQKDKIAVLPFEQQGEQFETEALGIIISEWLITAFVQNGRFEVVERKLLNQVIEEHQMAAAGMITRDTVSKIGRILGVKAIISGSVVKYGGVLEVNARIIDVENASIVTAENISCDNKSQLHEQVDRMAAQIINNFPLTGLIAKRTQDKVIIALGELAGVKPGMVFISYEEGDIVKHPKTQEIIYIEQVETGKVHVSEVQEKISKGIIIEESLSRPVQYGNFVKSINGLPDNKSHRPASESVTGMKVGITEKNSDHPREHQGETSRIFQTTQGGFSGRELTDSFSGIEFVWVEGGCYLMGCDSFFNCGKDEKPKHEVCVDGFYIGKYEVTQKQWTKLMGKNPAHFNKGDNFPVEMISRKDVQQFINKINGLSDNVVRLPTEAEWEYACRSGGREEDYCGGSDADALSWNSSNSNGSTHPAGAKEPNGLGIYDMSGNVWEWVQDYYNYEFYQHSPRSNPQGPSSGSVSTRRGGSFLNEPMYLRSTNRAYTKSAKKRTRSVGFRLVLPVQ